MGILLNRAKANTATTGTGAVTPSSTVVPFQSWAASGAIAGGTYDYLIEDGTAWECGQGIYNGTTITRPGPGLDRSFASSTGALLNLSGSATIACVANRDTLSDRLGSLEGLMVTTTTPSVNFLLFRWIVPERPFLINRICFHSFAANPTTKFQPFVYSCNSAVNTAVALLGSGPQVTGTIAGQVEAPLTTPVPVNKGDYIWIGISVIVSAIQLMVPASLLYGYVGNGGSTVPPAGPLSLTTGFSANIGYGFWAT